MNNEQNPIENIPLDGSDARQEARPGNTAEPQPGPQEEPRPKHRPDAREKKPYQFPPVQPVRRVGTLTMGFALMMTGVIALVATFFPSFDLTNIFKLSPVIFIFLGFEILFAYFFHKGERIKYDFLSGFVCFILICGGMSLAVVPTVMQYVGPDAQRVREQLQDQVENDLFESLRDYDEIDSMSVNAYLPYSIAISPDFRPSELVKDAVVHVRFDLEGSYQDEHAFAADCRKILDRLGPLEYRMNSVNFRSEDAQKWYELDVSDKFQWNKGAERLAERVRAVSYDEEYDSYDEDYEEPYVEEPEESLPEEDSITSSEVATG